MERNHSTTGVTLINGESRWGVRFLHLDGARLWAFVAICALFVLLECLGDEGRALLRFERAAILHGEYWRLITGHLAHLGWMHMALNVMGLLLMWSLFLPDYRAGQWLLILALSAAAIDTGFLLVDTQLRWYVGLSGVLHGVMAAGTLAHLRRREGDAWLLAAFLVGKLAYEQLFGAVTYSAGSIGGSVVVDAHLYGAIGGLAMALVLRGGSSRTVPIAEQGSE